MTDPGTYLFYTLLMGFMILLSLPSTHAITNRNGSLIGFQPYWGPNLYALVIIYAFIIGCRYYVGIDYKAYLEWYLDLKETGLYPREIEFGYEYLNRFLNYTGAHYAFLFISLALFQIIFYFKSLEKFPFLIPWFTFFFFTYLLLFSSMNIMRQTLAWFVFFYALNLAVEKKYGWAALCILFGFSFHKSILIAVALYPLLGFDWFKNKYLQIGLLLFVTVFASQILAIALNLAAPIVSLIGYSYYVENLDYMYEISAAGDVGAGTARALYLFLDLVIIWYSTDLKETFRKYHFYKYYNIYFLGAFLDRIVYDNFILARTNDYLLNFRVLILSFLCFFFFNSRSHKLVKEVLGYTIVVAMIAFFYRAIYNAAAETSPFRFLFFENVLQDRPHRIPE